MSKILCSRSWLYEIDSFDIFKNKIGLQYVRNSKNRLILEIPPHNLKIFLTKCDDLKVTCNIGSYIIRVEKKSCNYGGFYYFFHCPSCKARMRKLYCIEDIYLCRKCANLGYYSQRLRPAERNAWMSNNVINYLKSRAGSLDQKPPWMKKYTFQKLRRKFVRYDEKRFIELKKNILNRFSDFGDRYIPPFGMYDAYSWKEEL